MAAKSDVNGKGRSKAACKTMHWQASARPGITKRALGLFNMHSHVVPTQQKNGAPTNMCPRSKDIHTIIIIIIIKVINYL